VEVVVALLAFALLAVVVVVIAAPLRASLERTPQGMRERVSPERAELEAEREAKYREIRDAELDFRTGKLSREDYASLDAVLRSEGLEILNRLEGLDDAAKADPEVEG
jgi:hypothetical protein